MELITFSPDISEENRTKYKDILPQVKSHVVEENINDGLMQVRLFTACKDKEEVNRWIRDFEQLTKTNYSVRHSSTNSGRILLLKRVLWCHHNNPRTTTVHDTSKKGRAKNLNCPSSIKISLYPIKKKFRSKDMQKNILRKEHPCEIIIVLTHNHSIESGDTLKFRRVGDEVTKKLIDLYRNGHSPASALEMIKSDILLNNEDAQSKLSDRYYCPDYNYCYRVYKKNNLQEGDSEAVNATLSLEEKIKNYNSELGENSILYDFQESSYVICICPPFFQRIHEYVEDASQIVYMDSSLTGDHGNSRIYILLTHSEMGGLPLGIIITSSHTTEMLQTGLEMLKAILKNNIFFNSVKGPEIFLTNDYSAEQVALNNVWSASKIFVGAFHVLQSLWRWLVKTSNGIPFERQLIYFEQIKEVLFSKSEEECLCKFEMALENAVEDNYKKYLDVIWQKREMWAFPYKVSMSTGRVSTNNIADIIMRILKDKYFYRIKSFNLTQTLDFVMTKFIAYYEVRLSDATNNQLGCNIFSKTIECPTHELIASINIISDCIALVPNEPGRDLFYVVNLDALQCSCYEGNNHSTRICKHIEWATAGLLSDKFNTVIDSKNKWIIRNILATEDLPTEWYKTLYKKEYVDADSKVGLGNISDQDSCPSPSILIDNSEVDPPASSNNDIEGYKIVEKLSQIFYKFIEANPEGATDALKEMAENADKLSSFAAFASACTNFGKDCSKATKTIKRSASSAKFSEKKRIKEEFTLC